MPFSYIDDSASCKTSLSATCTQRVDKSRNAIEEMPNLCDPYDDSSESEERLDWQENIRLA